MTGDAATLARALRVPRAPRLRAATARIDPMHLTLAGVLLTYVWRVQDLVPGMDVARLPTLATLALGAMVVIDRRITTRMAPLAGHAVWRVVPWLALAGALSAAVSIAPRWSVDFLVRSFLPALALAVIVPAAITASRDAVVFAGLQMVGALLYCVAVFFRFDVDASGRLGSLVYYDANDIGMLLVCTLPLTAWFARHARHALTRAACLGIAATFLFTVARTGSRGAFIGLVAVCAYLVVRMRSVHAAARVGVAVVALLALLVGAGERYREKISTIADPTADYNWVGHGDGGRMSIWQRGLGYAADNPVFGVGLWAFPIAEGTISPIAARQEYGRGVKWSAAHNSFVQVLAELGIPGFLVFVTLIGRAFACAGRLARDCARAGPRFVATGELATAHGAALAGYVVSGFFLSQAYGPYLYFVVGMLIGVDSAIRVTPPTPRRVPAPPPV